MPHDFYRVLQYKRDGDLYADMLILQDKMQKLEQENAELKTQLIKALLQMQEIFLMIRSNENR